MQSSQNFKFVTIGQYCYNLLMQIRHESEVGHFGSEGNKLSYRLTKPNTPNFVDTPQGVLLLHGASSAKGRGRVLFEAFQDYLASNNIASLAFDTRGVGTSEGDYTDSTLQHRLEDAETAYHYFVNRLEAEAKRLAIVGVSMGGHVTARLIGKHPERFSDVILVNSAAYGLESEDKRLKPDTAFTEAITKPRSWENSSAFEGIARLNGRVLLVRSELDTVIPTEVIQHYKDAVVGRFSEVVIPGIPHIFLSGTDEVAEQGRQILYRVTADFLT